MDQRAHVLRELAERQERALRIRHVQSLAVPPNHARRHAADMNSLPEIKVVSVSADIAVLAGGLSEPMHGDPADRLIVATTSTLGVPLVTGDKKLRAYRGVKTIW